MNRLLALLLVVLALFTAACGDLPTSPSRDKLQPEPTVTRE